MSETPLQHMAAKESALRVKLREYAQSGIAAFRRGDSLLAERYASDMKYIEQALDRAHRELDRTLAKHPPADG